MKDYFYQLADFVQSSLQQGERFTLWLSGERSDFVRFNRAKIRQAGQVQQVYLRLQLIQGQKQIQESVTLSGHSQTDQPLVASVLGELRGALRDIMDDPHLLLCESVVNSEQVAESLLPATDQMLADVLGLANGVDLVGLLASGDLFYGFANDLGQRNWHQTSSWNFDWSLYARGDKAVKRSSAGFQWSADNLHATFAEAQQQLQLLGKPPMAIKPGSYRAYLTPAAVGELLDMLNWGGLSEKALRTKQSPLEKLALGEASLSPLVNLNEQLSQGLAPSFQGQGFIRPTTIELIRAGQLAGTLVSPRTAKEYGLAANASGGEAAESMVMSAGTLAQAEVLQALDTGLYISNLWYLNFSDRASCGLTGMTRFACFWVEHGEIVAPLEVMRFDDSLYRLLGSQLEALTEQREFLADTSTYGGRSSASKRLPGALVSNIKLVL